MLFGRRSRSRQLPYCYTTRVESADQGLYFRAKVYYRWHHIEPSSANHQSAFARSLLHEAATEVAQTYRILQVAPAEAAINRALSRTLHYGDSLSVEGSIRLRASRRDTKASEERAREEFHTRSEMYREDIRLEALNTRISDTRLGLVWWFERYFSVQGVDNVSDGTSDAIDAFKQLQQELNMASIASIDEEKLLIRRKIEQIFETIEDPKSLDFTIRLLDRFLQSIGHQPF